MSFTLLKNCFLSHISMFYFFIFMLTTSSQILDSPQHTSQSGICVRNIDTRASQNQPWSESSFLSQVLQPPLSHQHASASENAFHYSKLGGQLKRVSKPYNMQLHSGMKPIQQNSSHHPCSSLLGLYKSKFLMFSCYSCDGIVTSFIKKIKPKS